MRLSAWLFSPRLHKIRYHRLSNLFTPSKLKIQIIQKTEKMRIIRLLLLLTQTVKSSGHWSAHVSAFRKASSVRVPSELEQASKRRVIQVITTKVDEQKFIAKLDRLQVVLNPELRRSKKQVQGKKRHHKRPRRHI